MTLGHTCHSLFAGRNLNLSLRQVPIMEMDSLCPISAFELSDGTMVRKKIIDMRLCSSLVIIQIKQR